MRFHTITLAAAVAAVACAESITAILGQIPTCSNACFVANVPKICPKGVFDFGCQCMAANKAKLTTILSPCVLKACSTKEALQVVTLTNKLCKTYDASGLGGSNSIPSLLGNIPTCADDCFTKDVPTVCPNGVFDFGCQCVAANKAKLTTLLTPCVLGACSTSEALQVSSTTNKICALVNAGSGGTGGSSGGTGGSGGGSGGGSPTVASSTPIVTPTAPTGFSSPNAAPAATGAPIGVALAAAIAFAL